MTHPQNTESLGLCTRAIRSNQILTLCAALAICLGVNALQGQTVAPPGGKAMAWGMGDYRQTNVPPDLTNVIQVSGGYMHALALKSDGTCVAWGDNNYGQTNIPAGLKDVRMIAAGYANNFALKSNGTVVAWGMNNFGQNNLPPGLTNVAYIASGAVFGMALKSNGTVLVWGDNRFGQLYVPPLTNVVALVAGYYHCMALKKDGTVVAWGHSTPAAVPANATNIVALAGGGWHALALKKDGTVLAWGANGFGQSSVPSGLNHVLGLGAGAYHSTAFKDDGTVVGWGSNPYGQASGAGLSNIVQLGGLWYSSLAISGGTLASNPPPPIDTNPPPVIPTTRIIALSGNLSFGSVTLGQTATRTLTLSNSGNAALTISGITYPVGFTGNWTGSIAPGATQNVTVTFTPASATTYSGSLTVNSDATSGANTLPLSGTGTQILTPAISLMGTLSFGDLLAAQSATRSFTISNPGTAPLTVSSISYPAGFSGNWSSGIIPVGNTVNVQVTFLPAAAGAYDGNVTVTSDAASGANTLPISGRGIVTNGPALYVTPAAIDFGAIPLGSIEEQSVFITNTSASTISGYVTLSSPFMLLSSSGYNLAPGQGTSILIRYYTAASPTTNTGTLTFSAGGATPLPLRGASVASTAKTFMTSLGNVPGMSNGFNGWIGMKITIGTNPLIVNALGRWCYPGNGRPHTLKLVKADTGVEVPNSIANISMASAPVGMMLYGGLPNPVTLNASTAYYLLCQENTEVFFNAGSSISVRTDARCDGPVSIAASGSLTFSTGMSNRCAGPLDFKYIVGTPPPPVVVSTPTPAPAPPRVYVDPYAPQIYALSMIGETAHIAATGIAGQHYRVLISPDMSNWIELSTVVAESNGNIDYENVVDANLARFYRLELVP
jgi:hypothetical protein